MYRTVGWVGHTALVQTVSDQYISDGRSHIAPHRSRIPLPVSRWQARSTAVSLEIPTSLTPKWYLSLLPPCAPCSALESRNSRCRRPASFVSVPCSSPSEARSRNLRFCRPASATITYLIQQVFRSLQMTLAPHIHHHPLRRRSTPPSHPIFRGRFQHSVYGRPVTKAVLGVRCRVLAHTGVILQWLQVFIRALRRYSREPKTELRFALTCLRRAMSRSHFRAIPFFQSNAGPLYTATDMLQTWLGLDS